LEQPGSAIRFAMKFPMFPDPRMVGLSVCGQLQSPSDDTQKVLQKIHERRPFVTYRAKTATVHAHILGGKASSPAHLHIDLFKDELLKADNVKKPKDDATRKDISNDLDAFLGSKVYVTYTGFFLVERPEISGGSLIQPLRYGGEDDSKRYIRMTSATFEMVGLRVRRLVWRLKPDDRFRIELSYSQEVVISDDYLTAHLRKLSQDFDLFAVGKPSNAPGK
jgi:hypothetical protein